MNPKTFTSAAILALGLLAGPVQAALPAYMTVTGRIQGPIQGSVTQEGREGMMQILSTAHEIVSPRDAASGLPTGRRQHKPFTITKPLDKATPLLAKALTTNENLTEVVIRFWRPSLGGAEVQFFMVKLTNANIASHSIKLPATFDASTSSWPELEEISFTYQKITWTWTDGGVTHEDSWSAGSS